MWSRLQRLLSNVLLFLSVHLKRSFPKDAGWERILEPPLLVFESSSLKKEVLLLRSGSRIVKCLPNTLQGGFNNRERPKIRSS